MSKAPCKECGARPKAAGRHRCVTCALRHAPIGEQVEAATRRLAMVPPELRMHRREGQRFAPPGQGFCAGCQSYRDDVDMGEGQTMCKACRSAKSHATMVAKTYGLTAAEYDRLLKVQGGKCAICRARPKSKRLAVDHDHKTGAVRGLLCSRCNHDLMGSAWDSMAMALALWHYMNTPPTSGAWTPPEAGLSAPSAAQNDDDEGFTTLGSGKRPAEVIPPLPEVRKLGVLELMALRAYLDEQLADVPF